VYGNDNGSAPEIRFSPNTMFLFGKVNNPEFV
jgi:hypothetical protein